MKNNNITRFVLGAGLTIALTAALTFSAAAADQLKGAQLQIGQTPATAPSSAVVIDQPVNLAACPACTNVSKPFVTSAGRGAFVKSGVVTSHQCPLCKTTTATVGAGKAKVDRTTHTCGNGVVASCCSGMAGM